LTRRRGADFVGRASDIGDGAFNHAPIGGGRGPESSSVASGVMTLVLIVS